MEDKLIEGLTRYDINLGIIDEEGHRCALQLYLAAKERPPTPQTIRRGRKKKEVNQIFASFLVSDGASLKKDNMRTRLVRGHKKCLRELMKASSSRNPKPLIRRKGVTCLHSVDRKNDEEVGIWQELLRIYAEDQEHFNRFSRSTTQIGGGQQEGKRNYNDQYCSWYFASEPMKRSYRVYLDLVFVSKSCEELCSRMRARCCADAVHSPNCSLRWSALKGALAIENLISHTPGNILKI